jgi:hypothetical protein
MAQILIRKRKHFAEDVQPAQWSQMKWDGRPLRGDVVEVRENGYWAIAALNRPGKGWNREGFALIEVTNLSLAQVAAYQGSYSNATEGVEATKQFKNRYRLPNWDVDIPWVKTVVTVGDPPVTVEEWYYIRSNIHGIVTPVDKAAV